MILGKIVGKTTTRDFKFEISENAKKFDYLQVFHDNGHYILAQIEEIEKDQNKSIATCNIIGYKDENGKLHSLRSPLDPGIEVLKAEDDFILETLGLKEDINTGYIGCLDGHQDIKVNLNLNKVLTKHVAILAKSGSGKSYSVGVLLEEILLRKIPIVVFDPHGEYSTLKYPNPKDKERMIQYGIEPKGFLKQVTEFSPDIKVNKDAKPLKLSNKGLGTSELMHILPTKLSSAQMGLIYTAVKNLGGKVNLNELIYELEVAEDNNSKWTLINIFEYLKKLDLFSDNPTLMGELVQPGKMSIINLRGVNKDIQEIVAYKVIQDLFNERKKGIIPPFFLVIEECHNFVPERSFGEAKSSGIIRQIAAEGRKFGLGICLISQRPSRVEKSALSQASTQIILKVTNPNDVRAIGNSVEGITKNTEKDLPNLAIGTALVSGLTDLPLLVNIRPRMSKHGGEAVSSFVSAPEGPEKIENISIEDNDDREMLPIIKQKFSYEDIKLMHGEDKKIKSELIPCVLIRCVKEEEFNILIDLMDLQIIDNIENVSGPSLLKLKLQSLNNKEEKLLDIAIKLQDFKPADLFGKSGLQFSELHETISTLVNKGYFIQEGSSFELSPSMQFLANIDLKQFYQNIEFNRTNLKPLESKYKYDTVKGFLTKFFEITDIKECYIEKYSIEKNKTPTGAELRGI
jgi:uncharacterized protein